MVCRSSLGLDDRGDRRHSSLEARISSSLQDYKIKSGGLHNIFGEGQGGIYSLFRGMGMECMFILCVGQIIARLTMNDHTHHVLSSSIFFPDI